jgi:hypothetical protein
MRYRATAMERLTCLVLPAAGVTALIVRGWSARRSSVTGRRAPAVTASIQKFGLRWYAPIKPATSGTVTALMVSAQRAGESNSWA